MFQTMRKSRAVAKHSLGLCSTFLRICAALLKALLDYSSEALPQDMRSHYLLACLRDLGTHFLTDNFLSGHTSVA